MRSRNPERNTARGRVYCFRGQGIVFSPGMAVICRQLRQEGFYCKDLRCMGDGWVVRQLQQDLLQQMPIVPIILVGHSAGGRAAIHAATQMAAMNISVELLITVDVAFPPILPLNIKNAINLYRTQRRIYPAAPLVPCPGSNTFVNNVDLDSSDSPIQEAAIHHLNITSSPGIQALILEAIRSVKP